MALLASRTRRKAHGLTWGLRAEGRACGRAIGSPSRALKRSAYEAEMDPAARRRCKAIRPSVALVLKVAAACAITAAVAGSLDWSRVEAAWRGLRITRLVWAALAIVMAQGLIGLRWAWLASQVAGTPAGRAFRDAIVATLFSLVTPAGVGGDVYCVAASPTGPGSRMRTGTIVMTERLLGIFVYALIFLACFTLLVFDDGVSSEPCST